MKVALMTETTHKPFNEAHRVSCLRENLTSSSDGEGLETGCALSSVPRQSLTRQLDLRNIKTTLGMEMLSCKTPAMAQKEIWVYLLAYNLIRLMMAQSALLADRLPRQLSFKHTLQIWIAWDHHGTNHDDKLYGLFFLIAQQQVGDRPGRIEPRAIKRRPKPFPLLTEPREIAREKVRKHGRPEKLK